MGFFDKLKNGLLKTRKGITEKIDKLLVSFGKVDQELFDELEEALITSDLGVDASMQIIDGIKHKVKENRINDPLKVKGLLKEELLKILGESPSALDIEPSPAIIMVIGVNGVGKTTSIGKMASLLKKSGKKVILAAAEVLSKSISPPRRMQPRFFPAASSS